MISVSPRGPLHFAITSYGRSNILWQTAKSTPGMWWDGSAWIGYPDAVEVTIARALAYGEKLSPSSKPIKEPDASPSQITLLRPAFRDLYPYQAEALRFLIATAQAGAVLGLAVGTGKTCVALRLARALKEPTLVIAPAFASSTWERETAKWWPEAAPAYVLKGTKLPVPIGNGMLTNGSKQASLFVDAAFLAPPSPQPAHLPGNPKVVIGNYHIIHAWADYLIAADYRFLILDECHMIQGANARRTQFLYQLRQASVAAIGLTGTPRPNFTRNLHLMCDILSPGRFGKFFGFGLRYCGGKQVQVDPVKLPDKVVWNFDGSSNETELANRMRHFMFRRTKAEVGGDLPVFTRQIVEFDVSSRITKRKGPSPYASLLGKDGKIDRVALRAMLAAAADRKLPQIADLIASHIESGERVVAYTYRRKVAEALVGLIQARGTPEASYLHGGMDPQRRQKLLAKLRDHTKLLAVTIDSMGVAVDLTHASIGVVAELTYEPHELEQVEGRQHRRGQTKPVLYQYCIARGSIDELIKQTVIDKLASEYKLLGDSGTGLKKDLKKETTEEVLDRLAQRILGK